MRSSIFALVTASVLVAACSSSSDSGGGGTAQITTANAEAIASAVYTSSSGLVEIGDTGNPLAVLASADRAPSKHWFDLAGFVRSHAIAILPTEVRHVVRMETTPCSTGQITEVWDDADNDGEVSTGDTISLSLMDCEEAGDVVSGTIVIDNLVLSGSPSGDFVLSLRMTIDDLTITAGSEMATLNGQLQTTLSKSGSQITFAYRLSAGFTGGEVTLLAGTAIDLTVDESTGGYTFSTSGSLEVVLVGSVSYQTGPPFTGTNADEYPTGGTMLIRGSNGSSLRLIAVDAVNVRIEVDEDGDGTYETEISTTWLALDE